MQNRIKQLPLNVQKRVYEIAGLGGTICSDVDSTEYNWAMGAFMFATKEELEDFLFDHAKYNLEHRISWHHAIQEFSGWKTRWNQIYNNAYLRSPEWKRKRDFVMQRAMRPMPPEPPFEIRVEVDSYGRRLEFIEVKWKPLCEREGCSNEAKQVHHHNYERVGKERIGREPEASEENDLIALCGKCHVALHDR